MIALHAETDLIEDGGPDRPVGAGRENEVRRREPAVHEIEPGKLRVARQVAPPQVEDAANGEARRRLPVDAAGRIDIRRPLRDGKGELLAQQVGVPHRAAGQRLVDGGELRADERIDRRGKSVAARDVEQVHGAHRSVGGAVAKDTALRVLVEERPRERRLARLNRLLEVGEVEQLAFEQRTADIPAPFVQPQLVFRQAAHRIQPGIRVQRVVTELLERLPVHGVGAALGDELHLHRTLGPGVRGQPGCRNRHLLDRAEADRRERKEAGAAAAEALRVVVDAVERDVDRTAGKAVEGAEPLRRARRRPGRQQRKAEHVAARERKVRNFTIADRRRHGRRGRFDHRRLTDDAHLFLQRRHRKRHVDVAAAAGFDDDAVDDGRLEADGGRQDPIAPRLQRREHESSLAARLGALNVAGGRIGHFDGRVRHDGARRIFDGADDLARRADLAAGGCGRAHQRDENERGQGTAIDCDEDGVAGSTADGIGESHELSSVTEAAQESNRLFLSIHKSPVSPFPVPGSRFVGSRFLSSRVRTSVQGLI